MFMKLQSTGFWAGLILIVVLALFGKGLATLPVFSIIGPMVAAILLGMAWTTLIEPKLRLSHTQTNGIFSAKVFASKYLLRTGIILLGVRLDFGALQQAGPHLIVTELLLVALTLLCGYWLARRAGVDRPLAMVVAAGTAICGAAAAVAIAVQVRARSEQTVVGVATVAVLGTVFTLLDTLLYPWLHLAPQAYGAFTGATLHEIGHVIAAAAPLGDNALDTAILVKLTRVVLLAPVALLVGWWFSRDAKQTQQKSNPPHRPQPIPWFVLGFLFVGVLRSAHVIPASWTAPLISASLFLLTMGMAGLGLQVNMGALKGARPVFQTALLTSVLLSLAGWFASRYFLL
jgi:uncharacterized integral membrane protein (TIGR00698 family)